MHLYNIKPEASKARGILFLAINVGEMEFEDKMHFTTTYLYRPGTISKGLKPQNVAIFEKSK